MKNFSTNWYLYNTIKSTDNPKEIPTEVHSEEIKTKINKIKKAFR
jgi:hypothetical protein